MDRKTLLAIATVFVGSAIVTASARADAPDIKSSGPIAFAPDGVLLVADPQSAAVFAIETGDTKSGKRARAPVTIEGLDGKLAAQLGTSTDNLSVTDLAVNPATGKAYLSVSLGRDANAKVVIAMVRPNGKLKVLDLASLKSTKADLPDAPGPDAKDRRGRSQRRESITDIAYVDGRVYVAGLSNEEFASTLRAIPYPFKDVTKGTSVKIYHGAHGRFETNSPVRTFLPYEINGEPHLLAAYTCTPLVKLPIAQLKPGAHVDGTTIAELGNRNRPLDMVAYRKNGEDFVLIANSSRGIMKLKTATFGDAKGITERVSGGNAEGVPYDTVSEWKGIEQLDRKDDLHALIVRRTEDGALNLETLPYP